LLITVPVRRWLPLIADRWPPPRPAAAVELFDQVRAMTWRLLHPKL
jgi:hypothetical protein